MSDPFQDVSAVPSDEIKKGKLDEFMVQKLSNYITDEDTVDRGIPDAPESSTAAPTRKIKLKHSAGGKKQTSKGKTPVQPNVDTAQTPVRKSPRSNAGKKRKAPDSSNSDIDEGGSSPLAKKARALLKAIDGSEDSPASNSEDVTTANVTADKPNFPVSPDQAATPTKASKSNTSVSKSVTTKKPVTKLIKKPSTNLAKPSTMSKFPAGPSKKRARTPEQESEGAESESDQRPTDKKKQKKNPTEDMFKEFEATAQATNKGTSSTAPDCATLTEPWRCANLTCSTGQTWVKRGDGSESGGYGRKACSHWFGRNKKETGYIHDEVWHFYCRKCYQRQGYQANKSTDAEGGYSAKTKKHVDNVRMQIVRLQLWRPEMTFKIQLLKRAKDRLAQYHKALRRPNTSEQDAVDAVAFVPKTTAKGKETKPTNDYEFPIKHIEHFDLTYVGEGKTYDDLIEICDWVDQLNETGEAPCDPSVEFLPSKEVEGETIIDPVAKPTNYERWAAYCSAEADEQDPTTDADDGTADDDAETVDAPPSPTRERSAASRSASPASDTDSDDGDAAPSAPLPSGSGLRLTELGRRVGLRGNVGIVRGTGIRSEMEAEARAREAAAAAGPVGAEGEGGELGS